MTDASLPLDRRAEELFREYLARLDAGEPVDFDAICRANPTIERDLRRIKDSLDVIDRLRPESGSDRTLSERLKQKFGTDPGPTASLDKAPRPDSGASSTLFERLRGGGTRGTRYKLLGEVARGGMGVILKIWDDELRRTLAMKVVLGRGNESKGDTPVVDPMTLGRFLEEAQVTGQLDHPGIVPVHELGLDADGRVYFTMRLVKGEDLRSIFEKVRTGEDGWSQVRALGVLLKVCEAMGYAHSKKVVHRDLKPANVMVGKFGEVYVMDWGLARVLGREDKHDLRIQQQSTMQSVVSTERREKRRETPDSPLVTMDGDILGTPSFMPPEQAKGQLDKVGPHSDVYSLGAMLYQLITGELPYVPAGAQVSQHTILNAVLHGPPNPIENLAPHTPPELVSICELAMSREISSRYADTQAFASDLRAYLEGRVVSAYETGSWAETRKWIKRNRPLAMSLAGALAILVGGVVTSMVFGNRAREMAAEAVAARNDLKLKNTELEEKNAEAVAARNDLKLKNTELEETNAALAIAKADADTKTLEAARNAETANRLKDEAVVRETRATARADALWAIQELGEFERLDDEVDYARSQSRPAHEWWLEQAYELVNGRPADPAHDIRRKPGLADHQKLLEEVRARGTLIGEGDAAVWQFGQDKEKRWWNGQLTQLKSDLINLSSRIHVAAQSVQAESAVRSWNVAIQSISQSPVYSGLAVSPQLELAPLGPDPNSGLWEFVHIPSGESPMRRADGTLALKPEVGLIFVLLPGGRVPIETKNGNSGTQDAALTEVDLDPFFLSKYEMTREQWSRVARNWTGTFEVTGPSMLPATYISWDDCQEQLGQAGLWLRLPTEAQWEYGCRAGTSTIWWTGNTEATLVGAEFVLTTSGALRLMPIGWLRANPFGLHDIHGNAAEWCRDTRYSSVQPRAGDALRYEPGTSPRVLRGNGTTGPALRARSSNRESDGSGSRSSHTGLRPARLLTP